MSSSLHDEQDCDKGHHSLGTLERSSAECGCLKDYYYFDKLYGQSFGSVEARYRARSTQAGEGRR